VEEVLPVLRVKRVKRAERKKTTIFFTLFTLSRPLDRLFLFPFATPITLCSCCIDRGENAQYLVALFPRKTYI